MTRIAVLDDYQSCAQELADWSRVMALAEVKVFTEPFASADVVVHALKSFDVICLMRERTPFPREVLTQLPNLKHIVLTGKRSQNLDIPATGELGIGMSYTGAGPAPVNTPELTIGLMLALAHQIPAGDRILRSGGWLKGAPLGRVLYGSTLGIIGLGNVGSKVAKIAPALGMHVLAWSPNLTPERCAESGAEFCPSKQDLLARSDVVTLHMFLSEATRGLISAPEFAQMKPDALLINAARGPLVAERDLIEALTARRIGGAALDVYDQEPLPAEHPLRRLDNVVITPHFGYVTKEIYTAYYRETVEALEAYLADTREKA